MADAPVPVVVQPVGGVPDQYRAPIRTGAQAAAGVVVALLVRAALRWADVELPVEVTGALADGLTAALVGLAALVWYVAVRVVSRRWPAAEWLFLLKGKPVYVER